MARIHAIMLAVAGVALPALVHAEPGAEDVCRAALTAGRKLEAKGDHRGAIKALQQCNTATTASKEAAAVLLELGAIAIAAGDHALATRATDDLLNYHHPHDLQVLGTAYDHRGRALQAQGDRSGAIDAYRRSLRARNDAGVLQKLRALEPTATMPTPLPTCDGPQPLDNVLECASQAMYLTVEDRRPSCTWVENGVLARLRVVACDYGRDSETYVATLGTHGWTLGKIWAGFERTHYGFSWTLVRLEERKAGKGASAHSYVWLEAEQKYWSYQDASNDYDWREVLLYAPSSSGEYVKKAELPLATVGPEENKLTFRVVVSDDGTVTATDLEQTGYWPERMPRIPTGEIHLW